MKPAEQRLIRALDTADPAIRLYLFHGPDEAGARAFATRLGAALGDDAERIDLTSAMLKGDPARLADEAAAIGMFGGRRWVRIDPASDEAADAVAALLEAPAAGNPVVALGPGLRKDSKLVKLATASSAALVHACYPPEGREADAVAIELGRALGLSLRPDIARRVVTAGAGDRAIIASELEKLALYLDAAPDRPKPVEHEALDALGADAGDGDMGRLVTAVFAGDSAEVDNELGRLASEGIEGVPLLRALQRRGVLLAQLRAQIAGGEGIERVMETSGKAIFFKERDAVRRALARWTPEEIATALARLGAAERAVKSAGFVGEAATGEALLAISRHAARRR